MYRYYNLHEKEWVVNPQMDNWLEIAQHCSVVLRKYWTFYDSSHYEMAPVVGRLTLLFNLVQLAVLFADLALEGFPIRYLSLLHL